MIFTDAQFDEPLHRDLLQNQVYSMAAFNDFANRSEGRLMDVLVEQAEKVDSGKWIAWLIQRHGLIRYGEPAADESWVAQIPFTRAECQQMAKCDLYPIERWRHVVLVGVCRPEGKALLEMVKVRTGGEDVFGIALSPLDVRRFRDTFRLNKLFIT